MSQRKDDPAEMARMRQWLHVAATEIGIADEDYAPFEAALLALTRTVAHEASRPGAPLTNFMVGVAAGRGEDPERNADRLRALAEKFAKEEGPA